MSRAGADGSLGRRAHPSGAVAPWIVGFVAFAVYVFGLCPTVYLGDSGEIASAVAGGGVAHPPGYPFFTLLGSGFVRWIAWGEPAWRLGILVALCAAATVGMVVRIAVRLGASTEASIVAGAALAVARGHWNQAERVEVYSLHTTWLALAVLAALAVRERPGGWRAAWLAMAVSLGGSHHTTFLLSVPGLLAIAGGEAVRLGARTGAIAGLATGPLCYLDALRRARAYPILDWGGTRDVASLWRHAASVLYHGLLAPPTWASVARSLGVLHDNLPGPLLLASVAGFVGLGRRSRSVAFGWVAAAVAPLAFSMAYAIEDLPPYLLGPTVLAAPCVALGLDAAGRCLSPRWRPFPILVAGVLVAAIFAVNRPVCDLRGATGARDLALAKLGSCPKDAVLLTTGDNDTFPLWYAQQLLGVRRDVTVISRDALRVGWREMDREPSLWYARSLARQGVPVRVAADSVSEARRLADDGALIEVLEGALATRPLRTTFATLSEVGEDDPRKIVDWLSRRLLSPEGMVVRVDMPGAAPSMDEVVRRNRALRDRFPLPPLAGMRSEGEVTTDYVARHAGALWSWQVRVEESAGGDPAPIVEAIRRWAPDLAPERPASAAGR